MVLSFAINLTDLSWISLIKLFLFCEQNIQTNFEIFNDIWKFRKIIEF